MKKKFFIVFLLIFALPCTLRADFDELSPMKPLNVDELTKFVKDWPDFVNWSYKEDEYFNKDNAFNDLNGIRNDYSDAVIKWIEKRDWTVDRFFFVEQRIRKALKYIMLEEKNHKKNLSLKQNIKMIKQNDMIEESQRKAIIKRLNNKIRKNNELLNSFGVTKKEVNLIRPVTQELWSLFDYSQ
jgi:hypothetical protein